MKTLDQDDAVGYASLDGVVVTVLTPRTIYRQGQATLRFLALALVLAALASVALAVYLWKRAAEPMVQSIRRLEESAGRVGAAADKETSPTPALSCAIRNVPLRRH